MKFKVGDRVIRNHGYSGEGQIGVIISIERGSETTANVRRDGRRDIVGWFTSRISLYEEPMDFDVDG